MTQPTLEEILAGLESDDEPEVEDKPEVGMSDNATIKAIRDAQKKAQATARELAKELKKLQAENEEFRGRERSQSLEKAFEDVELPDKIKAFAQKHYSGDPTPEAVKQYLVDEGLADLSAETGGTTEEKSQGFQPSGSNREAEGSGTKVTREEWLKLVNTNPAEAESLYLKNRVDLTEIEALQARDQV